MGDFLDIRCFLTSAIRASLSVVQKLRGEISDGTNDTHILLAMGIMAIPYTKLRSTMLLQCPNWILMTKNGLRTRIYLKTRRCRHHQVYRWSEVGLSSDIYTNAGLGQAICRGLISHHWHAEVTNFPQHELRRALEDSVNSKARQTRSLKYKTTQLHKELVWPRNTEFQDLDFKNFRCGSQQKFQT